MQIINRLPSTTLKGKSSYEIFFNTAPSLDRLRVLGYLCYAGNERKQEKFSARALPRVFMGYLPTKKGFKLYGLQSKQFLISRNMVFTEHVFPLKQIKMLSST